MSNSLFSFQSKFTQIIEIGQAHDASFGLLMSMVDSLSRRGVPIIKFQMHHAEYESSADDLFRIPFSYVDSSRYDYWKRMELSDYQWDLLKKRVEDLGSSFLCTPFSLFSCKKLVKMGVKTIKIGSGDVDNDLMIDFLASSGCNLIISSGMDDLEYVVKKLVCLKSKYDINVAAMHCVSSYPASLSDLAFSFLKEYIPYSPIPIGFSDHSGSPLPLLIAQSIGCSFGEAHFTYSREMFGPDASSSLTEADIDYLLKSQTEILQMFDKDKKDLSQLGRMKQLFGRSLKAITHIKQGTVITLDMIDSSKPAGLGIPASDYQSIVGRKALVEIHKSTFIQNEHLS